jgi:voltage-gated potassium channel
MLVIELVAGGEWWLSAAMLINWVVWGAFFLEFVLLFSVADNRGAYLRKAWLHLSVIPLAFPPLPEIVSGAGVAGVLGVLRFAALLAVLVHSCVALYRLLKHLFFDLLAVARHPWMFIFGPVMRKRGLGRVVLLFGVLATVAGLLHSYFEGHTPRDGLWWALVTLTTVGYGDVSSVTTGGRITGAALMVSGIGVLAYITASVAAYFVEGDYKRELHQEVQSVNKRLDEFNLRLERIERLLATRTQPDREE